MKSLRAILCLVFALLLVGLLAFQALAERPDTREIRDAIRWGDPDEVGWSRKADGRHRQVNESWWYDEARTAAVGVSRFAQHAQMLQLGVMSLGVEVWLNHHTDEHARSIRHSSIMSGGSDGE